jgi:hypothetical protein
MALDFILLVAWGMRYRSYCAAERRKQAVRASGLTHSCEVLRCSLKLSIVCIHCLTYSKGAPLRSQDITAFYGFLAGPGLAIVISYNKVSSGRRAPSASFLVS